MEYLRPLSGQAVTHSNFAPTIPPHLFRKRTARLDWRLLARVDIDRVMREGDLDALQSNIENLTFANIEAEKLSEQGEANFVKLLSLAQLIVEYLLYSQDFLERRRASAEHQAASLMSEIESLRKEVHWANSQNHSLRREVKENKRLIGTYEAMLPMSRAYPGPVHHKSAGRAFPCGLCGKIFSTEGYLAAHMQRRHAGVAPASDSAADAHKDAATYPAAPKTDDVEAQRRLLAEKEKDLHKLEACMHAGPCIVHRVAPSSLFL
jgi:zinc finger protein DZIP1